MGITPEETEQTCAVEGMTLYQEKCITFTDGKYKAALPWKQDQPALPTNYELVKRRTKK